MYDDVNAQNRDLDKTLDDFRDMLRRINNFNAGERPQRLHRCGQLEQHARTLRSAIILEIKAMEDKEMGRRYHAALKEKNAVFKNLCAELEMKRNEIDRDQLTAGEKSSH